MKPLYVRLTRGIILILILTFFIGMRFIPNQNDIPDVPEISDQTVSFEENFTENQDNSIVVEDPVSSQPESSPENDSSTESAQPSLPQNPSNTVSEENTESSVSSGNTESSSSSIPDSPSNEPDKESSSQTPTPPSLPAPTPTPTGKAIVGYYTSWSAYKGYTPLSVPASKLTHLNYAFAKIDPQTNRIALADPNNDLKNFESLRTLKKNNKHLKTLISVGGWDYSTYFSDIASTQERREAFAQSVLDFILEHGFDGVDLDWEYPVSGGLAGNTNRPQDKQNFTLLLQAIRNKLDAQGQADGRKYYLTIAGAASSSYLSKIEPTKVAALVDHIFIMAYDMHGPWDSYSDFNAPLYQPKEDSPQYKNSVYDAVSVYLQHGVPANKLILGMPFYGYIYQGVSDQNNGLYSHFTSAKSISYSTVYNTYLNNPAYTEFLHPDAQVPYLFGNNTLITYEDPQSIAAKASLAKSLGIAGVGAWELSYDTGNHLMNSAYQILYSRSAGTEIKIPSYTLQRTSPIPFLQKISAGVTPADIFCKEDRF